MVLKHVLALIAVPALLAGCGSQEGGYGVAIGPDKGYDRGFDHKHLSQLKAGIWIDPEGCDHWIIDDGLEGYLSGRYDDYGKPICSGAGEPNTVVGPFKSGSSFGDPVRPDDY
jgi:hypothetical protein